MRDGLYKIGFQTQLGTGAGVLVLEAGRLRGGDSAAYYVGGYRLDGDHFIADVDVKRHTAGAVGARLLFGLEDVRIRLEGDSLGREAIMTGSSPDAPDVTFTAVLQRLSD